VSRLADSIPGLCLLSVICFLLAGCASAKPDLAWQRIQEQGVIRVGMEANWVPFEYVDGTGQLSGFDVELARQLGDRLGLEVQFYANLSFDGLYDALTAGQVDVVISAVVVDVGRSADFAYSTPYFDAGQVLVVRPGQQEATSAAGLSIDEMQDLGDRVLAVELGSDGDTVARRWARRLAGLSLLHTDSADAALAAVASGQADAALTDRATALMALKARAVVPGEPPGQAPAQREGTEGEAGGSLCISGDPVTDEQYAVVLLGESDELLNALNAALAEMRRDGTLKELEKKWLGP
jgi:polar amino acid transport system substrate-binding protein